MVGGKKNRSTYAFTQENSKNYYKLVGSKFNEHFMAKCRTIKECVIRQSRQTGECVKSFIRPFASN